MRWNPDPAKLAAKCRLVGTIGWDSETFGHNVKETSPAYRAKVDVWSVAINGWGLVLPVSALESGPMREVLEDPSVTKVAHNARHDLHAAENHGVTVRGVTDTLELARVVWPGLESYTLKALRVVVLNKPERESFKWLTRPDVVPVPHQATVCICATPGCRKKTYPHSQFQVDKPKFKEVKVNIEDITPGHVRWPEKLAYAADDAVDAVDLLTCARTRLAELCNRLPSLPW